MNNARFELETYLRAGGRASGRTFAYLNGLNTLTRDPSVRKIYLVASEAHAKMLRKQHSDIEIIARPGREKLLGLYHAVVGVDHFLIEVLLNEIDLYWQRVVNELKGRIEDLENET